jgi:NAD(P)-dependent dehydrogenase (short-subunit alcohol dehydrogenase family)
VEKHASFWEVTESDYDLVLNTNLKGAFFATQAFVKHRIQVRQPGKVTNISSVHEELPFPHFTSHCASKGGVKMMMRNLSLELAPYGNCGAAGKSADRSKNPNQRRINSNPKLQHNQEGCARARQLYPMLTNPRWAASATASVRPTALSFSKIAVT